MLTAKTTDQDDAVRQMELAAYMTHCVLEPAHLMLALNLAMSVCYKFQNFIHAAGFARRLLELPDITSAKNAALATKVRSGRAPAALYALPSLLPLASSPPGRTPTRRSTPHPHRPAPPRPQAKKVLQNSESQARNTHKIAYDEASGFSLCAASLTPIAKGAELVRSPYSGAAYLPSYKGSVCVIDGMAQVGVETLGLVCSIARK
jgi:coatomer protein complex subunit alpha (xenin)